MMVPILLPCVFLSACQLITLSSAGEATTASAKDVQFSGWRPLGPPESLNTTEFVQKITSRKDVNATDDIDSSETRKSYLLVYPPRQNNNNQDQQHQGRNSAPLVRASPTQSRYHRMMSFGASEGSNKKTPAVYQRPKFPPVANPPPLPAHARSNPKVLPNYKPESTSQHQVQIQLLDGYIVPPGGSGISTIHAKEKGPQITTIPLSLNNVPEIRLLLPGDVHQQLNNLRQPPPQQQQQQQQQNPPPRAYPKPHIPNKENTDHIPREYQNTDVKVPSPVFESQRYPDVEGPRNHVRPNNNQHNIKYDDAPKVDNIPQQNNYNQNFNPEHRPHNEFSHPDPNPYPNTVSFPGQVNGNHFQENGHQGQVYPNDGPKNFEASNGGYQNNNNNNNINNHQQQVVRGQIDHVKTQSFSHVQRNRYVQNSDGQQYQNNEQVYQKSNQPGVFPSYPSQVQRGYRGESFRPLSNSNNGNNYNNNNGQGPNQLSHQQEANFGNNQNNNQYNNNNQNQNLGQNTWRGQPSSRGNNNYNGGIVTTDQQNFYNINNQNNVNNQRGSKTNYNSGQNNGNQNGGGFKYQVSDQDIIHQVKITETDSSSSTQSNGIDLSTQQYSTGIDNKTISTIGNPVEEIYFIPPVLSPDDIQTQVPAFDVPSTVDGTEVNEIGTSLSRGDNTIAPDTTFIQQKELESTDAGIIATTGDSRQLDIQLDGRSSCDCTRNCAPIQRSPNENFGTTIREIARSLNAEAFFEFVGLSDEELENMLSTGGSYTFFIPSNEAVSRLPPNLIDHWRQNNPDLTVALLNHVIMDAISLDQLKQGGRLTSRANDATIFVNNYNNEAVTVNGHRIVHGDVRGPRGGLIHVIDGTLCPVADRDIISTLRTCNKYDGFLTLADVTKLLDTMKEDGPYTVFLPSNEALTKIPSEELALLKENVTLLREFLDYHIVQGAYFSGDLKDGQYLTSLHRGQPIRVGIRVDGCYRRLTEANNSPLFKADIPTKNGVIHVTDWILSPSDLNWCEGVILP